MKMKTSDFYKNLTESMINRKVSIKVPYDNDVVTPQDYASEHTTMYDVNDDEDIQYVYRFNSLDDAIKKIGEICEQATQEVDHKEEDHEEEKTKEEEAYYRFMKTYATKCDYSEDCADCGSDDDIDCEDEECCPCCAELIKKERQYQIYDIVREIAPQYVGRPKACVKFATQLVDLIFD
jgi:hypothetical protein